MGIKQDSKIPNRDLTWFHCGFVIVLSQMGIWILDKLDQHFLKGERPFGYGSKFNWTMGKHFVGQYFMGLV
jgi:hypothetical protein